MSRSLWVWMVVGATVVAFGCLRWALAEEDGRRFVERGVDFGKPGRPARVPTVRPVDDEGTPPMTMAVSAPMTQAASRSVAAAASAVLGARGVASVMSREKVAPR